MQEQKIKELGHVLLQIGSLLMSNGASTARIRLTVDRIAKIFGYESDMFITHRALTLQLSDDSHELSFNSLKRTSPHGVNFKLVSGISRMSWSVAEEHWTLEQIKAELIRLQALPHYPRIITLTTVGIAGAAFCYFAGGRGWELLITFVATFVGLFVRQQANKSGFNIYLTIFLSALVATLIAGFFTKYSFGVDAEHAFATCVLFLIPGVPLINSFTDFFDGNILNGCVRAVQGMLISFMIALGLLSSYYLYQL